MTDRQTNQASAGAPRRRRRWPWLLSGVAVLAVALTIAGVSPYGLLAHNDDHAGTSHGCPQAKVDVAGATDRSSELLRQAAGSLVAADTSLSAPRFTTQNSASGKNECFTVTGYQDLPDTHESQPTAAAKLNAAWSAAGYAKVSPTECTTPDGYSISIGATSDGRMWLSSTSPPASP